MTKDNIRKRLEKNGYKVTTILGSGRIVVTKGGIYSRGFDSLHQAHKYYFGY